MQQYMGHNEEELKKSKDGISAAEEDRNHTLGELTEMKRVAQEATMKLGETIPIRMVSEVYTKLNAHEESLSNSIHDLKIKEMDIESLKCELEKAKQVELKPAEKDASLAMLDEELKYVQSSDDVRAFDSSSESRKKNVVLENELKQDRELEKNMFDSFLSRTKQVEQTKISLEESKLLEIASLLQKVEKSEVSPYQLFMKEALLSLNSELQLTKQNLAQALESEKLASSKALGLLYEKELLKKELKLAIGAEEMSKKAMDDLALALTEVATESNPVKEKLVSTQFELEHYKEEAEKFRVMLRYNEDMYKKLLEEARKEVDRLKIIADRLRLEAEDSVLAWNGKEMCFVDCMKRVEEDRTATQQENKRLLSSLLMAEKMTKVAKEENHKLRDILKQALNEANVAKEAAGIAKRENSQLKDRVAEQDIALDSLAREVENLRIYQSEENIKELNQKLSPASASDFKLKNHTHRVKEHHQKNKISGRAFSFDLNELRIPVDVSNDVQEEDPVKAEALIGSIFDITESPKATQHHRRKSSSFFTDEGETMKLDDFDHLDKTHFDEGENGVRKKKALLRRVSYIFRKKSFDRKESF